MLANVALALQALQDRSAALAERLKKMGAVLRFHGVPTSLQQRITDSIEYYWSQRYGMQDRELLELLPPRCAAHTSASVGKLRIIIIIILPWETPSQTQAIFESSKMHAISGRSIDVAVVDVCSVQTEVASKIVGNAYPAIGTLHDCSDALKAALASKWVMTITPPDEIVLTCGTQPDAFLALTC